MGVLGIRSRYHDKRTAKYLLRELLTWFSGDPQPRINTLRIEVNEWESPVDDEEEKSIKAFMTDIQRIRVSGGLRYLEVNDIRTTFENL